MGCALGNDLAATGTSLGTYVYEVVGNLYYVQIMLDDNGRIATIDQLVYYGQELAYILEVESR